jgi:hypothetical protein
VFYLVEYYGGFIYFISHTIKNQLKKHSNTNVNPALIDTLMPIKPIPTIHISQPSPIILHQLYKVHMTSQAFDQVYEIHGVVCITAIATCIC